MSKRKNRARNVGQPAQPKPETNVVAFEKPKPPAVKYAVTQIPVELLPSLAPVFGPFVHQACELSGGRYTARWIWDLAMRDEMQIWAVLGNKEPKCAFVTTTQLYPATGLHVVQILAVAGSGFVRAAPQIREALLAFKEQRGCHRIEWGGRKGFVRLWPGAVELTVTAEVE
jgi:hypothetical protein